MKNPKSTTLSPDTARATGYALASLLSLVVVTCAGAAKGPAAKVVKEPEPVAPARSVLPPTPPERSAHEPTPAPGAPRLERFRAALRELAGKHAAPVRVLFLGDSHAAADFWPDALRQSLQSKYGNGGPGFVHLGLGVYRHAGMKVSRNGKWRVLPKQPSLWMRQEDGVFGLGGLRTVPEASDSSATIELAKDAVSGQARWDLAFRLPSDHARFRINVSGQEARIVDGKTAPVGALSHVEWQTKPGAAVTVDQASGEPELFGVIVESTEPGAVVDTLGVNGARIGTPLAWEASPWIEEAARRRPALFVLEYGTNEVGDQVAAFRYGPEIESMVERVRVAAPSADCLILGPTDRAGPDWNTLPRVSEIEAVQKQIADHVGCAFFGTVEAMGGEGSLKRWAAESPPRAAPDRVHLTPRGYADVGAATAAFVLGER